MSLKRVIIIAIAVVIILAIIANFVLTGHKTELIVFLAGSTFKALKEAKMAFEAEYPNVNVILEPSGSVMAVRKIIDLHKRADLLIVADYRLIRSYLMPKYASWYVKFASNEIVLAYTNRSRYANEIGPDDWFKILLRPDIRFGISNPNLDPCGYRALAVLYMASIYYNDSRIWRNLVLKYIPNISVKIVNRTHYIYFPARPIFKGGRLFIRDKSIDLIGLLEMGVIDYAFLYKSEVVEHGLKYVELPLAFNLAKSPFINVTVVLYHGDPKREKAVRIGAIGYGLTIPKTCVECGLALKFVKFLLYGKGREILKRHGFTVLEKYEFYGSAPRAIIAPK